MNMTINRNRNLWVLAGLIAVAGMATSLYSIAHHMELRRNGHTEAACNINSSINCDLVAASKYSEVFGIPLGVWGLGYFMAAGILVVIVLRGLRSAKEHELAWFALAVMGVLSSLGLATISLGILGVGCLVCMVVYGLTLAQGVVAWRLWRHRSAELRWSLKPLGSGLSTAVIAVAIAVIGFNFLKPTATLPPELQDLPGKLDIDKGPPLFTPTPVELIINKNPYSGMGEDFRKGADDAKIVIVEFADYMCPACGQTAPILEELYRQLGQRALLVFKNYPLSNQCNSSVQSDMHPHSCDIAKLARCAGGIGKFWDYHLMAFEHQAKASRENALQWGRNVGLTEQQMNECLASQDIAAKIRDDVAAGNKAGVNSTPTIFINGRKYLGERSVPAMRSAIESL